MKKLLTLAVVAALVTFAVGCGETKPSGGAAKPSTAATTAPTTK
jgi:hypothetical protein